MLRPFSGGMFGLKRLNTSETMFPLPEPLPDEAFGFGGWRLINILHDIPKVRFTFPVYSFYSNI